MEGEYVQTGREEIGVARVVDMGANSNHFFFGNQVKEITRHPGIKFGLIEHMMAKYDTI